MKKVRKPFPVAIPTRTEKALTRIAYLRASIDRAPVVLLDSAPALLDLAEAFLTRPESRSDAVAAFLESSDAQ